MIRKCYLKFYLNNHICSNFLLGCSLAPGNIPRTVQTIPLPQIHKAVGIKWTTTEELLPEY